MSDGSDITFFVDWGDDLTVEEMSYTDPSAISPLNFTYTAVGSYNITAWASNERSYLVYSLFAEVDMDLVGTVTTQNTSIDSDTITRFAFALTAGTRVVLDYDYGDGNTDSSSEYTTYDLVPAEHTHAYIQMGVFEVRINASNSVRTLSFTFSMVVGIPITSFVITDDSPTIAGQNTTFTATLSNSSMVTCSFTFDDATYDVIYFLFTENAFDVVHQYPGVGVYNLQVVCENDFGTETYSKQIIVQDEIANLMVDPNEYRCIKGDTLQIGWTITNGTNLTFTAALDGGSPTGVVTYNNGDRLGSVSLGQSDYNDYGNYSLVILGENAVGSDSVIATIVVDRDITGWDVTTVSDYFEPMDTVDFTGSVLTGSRIKYACEFGDSQSTEQPHTDLTHSIVFSHQYSSIGYYTVNCTVANSVRNLELLRNIGIEYRITNDITLSAANITNPGTVIFTATQGSGNEPTSVMSNWDHGDSSGNETEAVAISTSSQYTHAHDYANYGYYVVHTTMYNNISSQPLTADTTVMVGVEITGLSISAAGYYAAVGEGISFVAHTDTGSAAIYAVDFGNGVSSALTPRTETDWTLADNTPISYAYSQHGTYVVTVSADNVLADVSDFTMLEPMTIQNVITGLALAAPTHWSLVGGAVSYEVTIDASAPAPSAGINCTWTYDDSTLEVTDGVALATGTVHSHQRLETVVGDRNTSVTCNNMVSVQTTYAVVVMEQPITGVGIALAAPAIAAGETAQISLSVAAGSHVTYGIAFGDSQSTTEVHPNTLDSAASVLVHHVYAQPDNYTITVTASNDIGSQEATAELIVQKPVSDGIQLTNDAYGVPSGPAIDFTFTPQDADVQDNVFIGLQYGDSSPDVLVFAGNIDPINPFVHSFQYTVANSPVGTKQITANLSNLISHKIVTSSIILQNEVTEVALSLTPLSVLDGVTPAVKTNDLATLALTSPDGTDIMFEIVGLGYQEQMTGEGGTFDFTHAWTAAGRYTVVANAANGVSSVSTTGECIVQNPVALNELDLTLSGSGSVPDKAVTSEGEGGVLLLHCDTQSGAPIPTNVTATMSSSSASNTPITTAIPSWPATLEAPRVTDVGAYTLSITLDNHVSKISHALPYEVQEKILGMQLVAPTAAIPYKTPMASSVSFNAGSHIVMAVDYGNADTASFQLNHHNPFDTHTFSFPDYDYPDPGSYIFKVNASNAFDSEVKEATVQIVADLPPMQLASVPTVEYIDSPVDANIQITVQNPIAFDVDVAVDYGDSAAETVTKSLGGDIMLSHRYSDVGFFPVVINISTPFDWAAFNTTISVQKRLNTLDLTAQLPNKDVPADLVFTVGSALDLTPVHEGGGCKYTWAIYSKDVGAMDNDGYREVVPAGPATQIPSKLVHVFPTPNQYVVSLEAGNGLGDSLAVEKTITIIPNGYIESFFYENALSKGVSTYFNVTLSTAVPTACIKMHLSDIFWTAESEANCEYIPNFDDSKFELTLPGQKVFTKRHNFNAPMNYAVEVFVYDSRFPDRDPDYTSGVVSVTEYCNAPILTSVGNEPTVDNAIAARKSEEIYLSQDNFQITIDCQSTSAVERRWEISGVVDGNGFVEGPLPDDPTKFVIKADGLYIQPLALDYGTYYADFHLEMLSTDLTANKGVYFVVLQSPITTGFEQDYRMVGADEEVTVDVASKTEDPDAPGDDTGFTFTWFCYRESESDWAVTNANVEYSGVPIPLPTDNSGLANDQGGCFGTGPAKLSINSATLSFNTATMAPDVSYIMHVWAQKGDRKVEAKQIIAIAPGNPVELKIQCNMNCQHKVNPDAEYIATGMCNNCPDPGQGYSHDFQWSLQVDGTTQDVSALAVPLGTKGSTLTLDQAKFEEGKSYHLKLKIVPSPDSSGFEPGQDLIVLNANRRPWGGNCAVNPPEGEALTTEFSLSCDDWSDDGDQYQTTPTPSAVTKLSYKYEYELSDGSRAAISSALTKLSAGKEADDFLVTIYFTIIDEYNTAVSTSGTVKVIPSANPNAVDDALDGFLQQGTSALSLDVGGTLSQLMAISLTIASSTESLTSGQDGGAGGSPSGGGSGTGSSGGTTDTASQIRQQRIAEEEKKKALVLEMTASLVTSQSTVPLSNDQTTKVASTISAMTADFSSNTDPKAMTSVFEFAKSVSKATSTPMEPEQQKSFYTDVLTASGQAVDALAPEPKDVTTEAEDLEALADVELTEEEEVKLLAEKKSQAKQADTLARQAADSMLQTQTSMGLGLAQNSVDNIQVTVATANIELAVVATEASSNMNDKSMSVTNASVQISAFSANVDAATARKAVGMEVSLNTDNFLTFDESAKDIDAPIMLTQVVSYDDAAKSGASPLENIPIALTQNHATDVPPDNVTGLVVDPETDIVYTSIGVSIVYSAVISHLTPDDPTITKIQVFAMINCSNVILCTPNATYNNFSTNLTADNNWRLYIPAKIVTGDLIIGMKFEYDSDPVEADSSNTGGAVRKRREVAPATSTTNSTVPKFNMTTGVARCRAWDNKQQRWRSDICTVNKNSPIGSAICDCSTSSDIKAFSSGFTAPQVNTIDFSNVFNNFSALLAENYGVFVTIFVIIGVYILLAIWARRADRKDVEKWGVLPLQDNTASHRNFYKLSVFTGMRRGAGTKSDPWFVLTGDEGDTGVRELVDKKKRAFSTSSIRNFILSTEGSLGSLNFLRIWHNNSGKSDNASWFLDKVVVEDLQTKDRYFFLCGQWLAVDEDDGLIDRILPVAGRDEVTGFNHLFFDKARKKLFDDHLWVSLVGRPNRSNFTRLQRLTCILALLFTTMVANMMWYQTTDVEKDYVLHVGPIVLSAATIITSIYGSLTVIPINVILVLVFRKVRPKDWPAEDEVMGANGQKIKIEQTEKATRKEKWWKRKYPLPYWAAYVAWAVALAVTAASGVVVIFYSLEWGKEKSDEWLTSLFLSTAQSVLLVQPVKVLFLAMIMALVFKTLEDDDSEDVTDKKDNAKGRADEELTDENLITLKTLTTVQPPEPLSKDELEKAREKRNYEKRMWNLLKEAAFYFMFLLLISFIVWGTKDPLLFKQNEFLVNEIAGGSLSEMKAFVTNGHNFWTWTREMMVPSIFYMTKYNGKPTSLRDRQYLNDRCSFRVGPVRMRQLRVVPGACDVLPAMKDYIPECNEQYSLFTEENRNFSVNWELETSQNYTNEVLTRTQKAFKYQSMLDLKGLPYWGQMATYGGGGYVAELGTTKGQALTVIEELVENNWIDYYTRGVFLEFTIYNPNINLFGYVNYLLEFPPTGAILPFPRVMTFKLYNSVSGLDSLMIASQILYMLLIFIFMIRDILKFRRERSKYWKDPWNYLELSIIISSFVAMSMFIMRELVGRLVLNDLADNIDQYMNFMVFAYYDEVYWYVIGSIVFMSNLKFLRLLRFNKHISHFAATLKLARVEVLNFMVTFMVLFLGFTCSGYLLFGRHMLDFHTVITVMESLYSMLVGKFDFREMEKADRLLGPVYFATFMVLMFFITINMFLGIIGNAYSEIRKNPGLLGDDYLVIDFIKLKAKKFLGMKEKEKREEVRYMDSMETLNLRLESLDKMVTDECRNILGLATQAQREENEEQATPTDKATLQKGNKSKLNEIACLAKLQQAYGQSGSHSGKSGSPGHAWT